jgi:hypothetical protein
MNRMGVCYDVGRRMMGADWHPKFDPAVVHRELQIIKNDLHCNAVRICGLDVDRLVTAAEDALTQGLEVWLSPELWDSGQDETLEYVRNAAAKAEVLRRKWPRRLVFSVGSELTLFMRDIVPGRNFFERMNNPSFWEDIKSGKHNPRLNEFLAKASEAVRKEFHGQITYFSAPLETVEWRPFDFVGVDMYRDARIRDSYGAMVGKYGTLGKPVTIGEFGCCTYRGAEVLGGSGFMIVFGMMADHLGIAQKLPWLVAEMIKVIPKKDGHYIRDEGLQAREIDDQLGVLDAAGVDGAFVFTFVSPTSPHSEDPRFDTDMGSYSLVKSYAEKDTLEVVRMQSARQGKEFLGVDINPNLVIKSGDEVGRHGATYPEMTWEPKESFRAVAHYYFTHQVQE